MTHRRFESAMTGGLILVLFTGAAGGVKTETLEYWDGDTKLVGYLAYDDSAETRRPGVLVFHEWWGLNEYIKKRTRQVAEMGYVVLAGDIYGGGKHTSDSDEAAKLTKPFHADRQLLRRRAAASLKQLKAHFRTDGSKVAAIGYSFGGTAALELARSGADLQAVVTFYAGLGTPTSARSGKVKPRILVLHGSDDPHVPPQALQGFQNEMRYAKADWQVNIYGGAVHSFANPDAGDDPADGLAYSERADRRSWKAMKLLFSETIGVPKAEKTGGISEFTKDKIARPVGKAGKVTGEAVKHGATWTWKKVTGKDDEKDE